MTLSTPSQASCQKIMAGLFRHQNRLAQTPEVSYFKKVSRLEKVTNFLRKLKDNPEPTINIRIWKKISLLDEFLNNGSHPPNEREWRTFFREFEANYISFKRSKSVVDLLLEDPDMSPSLFFKKLSDGDYSPEYIDFLARQLEKSESLERLRIALELEKESTLTRLGNNYQEYRLVREHLDKNLDSDECNETCRRYTQMLLGDIGMASEKEQIMFKLFFEGQQRPAIKAIRETLYAEQTFVLTRLKRERNEELLGFLKGLISQPAVFDKVLGFLYKSKLMNKTKAVQLFRLIYDAQARNVHFPKINRLLYNKSSAADSLGILENINSSVGGDELLVTFARRNDSGAEKKWKELLKEAQANKPELHEKMVEASKKAKSRGALSVTGNKGLLARVVTLLAIGGPTVGYFYFDGHPTSVETYVDGVEEDQDIDLNQPSPFSVTEIELEGDEDQALEEAADVIADDSESDSTSGRDPSSLEERTGRAAFTQWWCSIFSCRQN